MTAFGHVDQVVRAEINKAIAQIKAAARSEAQKAAQDVKRSTAAITASEREKLGYMTITQEVDLDAVEIAANAPDTYSVAIGNGSATSIDVTHNLGTRDIVYSIWENSGSYLEVAPATAAVIDGNALRLTFGVAPTTDQYKVVVMG